MKTSVMLESYCADIERLVRDDTLRPAMRLSVALPDICAALEDPQMQSSREQYVSWCAAWLIWRVTTDGRPVDGARLYRLHAGHTPSARAPVSAQNRTTAALRRLRMTRRARRERTLARPRVWDPAIRLEAFQVNLIEALVESTRRWYRERGANSAIVQRNLGLLLVSG